MTILTAKEFADVVKSGDPREPIQHIFPGQTCVLGHMVRLTNAIHADHILAQDHWLFIGYKAMDTMTWALALIGKTDQLFDKIQQSLKERKSVEA